MVHLLWLPGYGVRCEEALELNKQLITEEQGDYQKELLRNFKDFREKLEPMVSTKKKHKRSRSVFIGNPRCYN